MFAATQPTPIRPTPGGSLCTLQAHLSRQIQKTNPLCKHFSTSESAPNTLHTKSTLTTLQKRRARANAPVPPQTKSRSSSKICNSESAPVIAQARRQKDQPRHFNRRQKHTRHPASKLLWVQTCANANRIPTSLQCETVKENCVSIDRQNCFTKSVKQARKNIWTRRKTPLRARAWSVACYGTLFANMCIIRAYLEIIWLDFDRSCPYCSL